MVTTSSILMALMVVATLLEHIMDLTFFSILNMIHLVHLIET